MRGISEERLIEEIGFYDIDVRARDILNSLIDQCQEFNQWQPIESAPKDRHVLLHASVGPINCRSFVGNAYDSWPWVPTHWMELPSPPELPEPPK